MRARQPWVPFYRKPAIVFARFFRVSHEDLSRISSAVVQAQKKALGKGPENVKATFLDDMLIVVSKGGITTAERTMLNHGQDDAVREIRRVIEIEMVAPLTDMVSEITGREVIGYQSQIMFAPDRVIAVYVFDDAPVEHSAPNTG